MKIGIFEIILWVAITCTLGALVSGAIMYWANSSVMVHALYVHFGIADLTYSQYVSGAFLLSLVVNCFRHNKVQKNEND